MQLIAGLHTGSCVCTLCLLFPDDTLLRYSCCMVHDQCLQVVLALLARIMRVHDAWLAGALLGMCAMGLAG